MSSNCSNLLDMINLQEQVKKAFCNQKLFWTFTVWINCSSDLKFFANSQHSASNLKSFSWSLEQFFNTVGQNNLRAFQTIAEIKTTNFGFCPLKFTQLFNQSVEVFVYTTCGWEGSWVEHREHPWRTLHTTFHSYCCSQATRVIEFVELK